jgi:putative ABC transport system permease protein
MKLLAGRNLVASDSIREFVINLTYCKVLGIDQPDEAIGELIYFHGIPYTVVGVIEDFHEGSFHEIISPIAIGYFPRWQNKLAIKLASGDSRDISSILSRIESQWKVVFPDTPFNYSFFDDEVKVLYQKEENIASLVNVLMLIAIFISGMGVFGLAMFNAEARTKEVRMGKILGAGITTIVILFSKEFMVLVLLAMVMASPIAWYFTNEWLSNFAYRVDVEWTIFLYAGLIALATAIIASSSQALKAALANPIKSLRSE